MRRGGILLLAGLLLTVGLATPASAGPEPGLFCEEGEAAHGRLFPEPDESNDFISFDEARCGLDVLTQRHGDLIEVKEIGQSVGWMNVQTQDHDTFPVLAVEVTDETVAEKEGALVFINSIHGNEKGAREGALRSIEDLLTGQGIAPRVEEATGRSVAEVLSELRLVFTFPNPDGWVHEYPQYRPNDGCAVSVTCTAGVTEAGELGLETQGFTRGNGNGTDLNRQYGTTGTPHPSWPAYTEPEIRAEHAYLQSLPEPVIAGVDLHGMLNAENLTYLMIKDTQRTLDEVLSHERVARLTYDQIHTDPVLEPWRATVGPASVWGATYDLLGYSAPGTGGAYIVQDIGLNAPGFTVELAYNHIAFDNKYAGPGQAMNVMHVAAMRDIVVGFIQFAHQVPDGVHVEGESGVAYLPHPDVIQGARYDGTDADPNEALEEIARRGGHVHAISELTPDALARETHLVIPAGALEAYKDRLADASPDASLADPLTHIIKPWVEQGGTLVLTDQAVELAADLGLATGTSEVEDVTGKVDVIDEAHPLAEGTNAPVQSITDGNPLRYDAGTVPTHCIDGWKGTVVGHRDGGTCTVLGEASLGEGTVRVMGVALPPPVSPGPQGVDGYALTPNGYRILLNTLDLQLVEGAGADTHTDGQSGAVTDTTAIPAPALVTALVVLAGLALAVRRRE